MLVQDGVNMSRILAVDDSPDNLFLIETVLDAPEYDLVFAEDGWKALSKITECLPDLVLLDIMMPGMNGYEVTERIRQNDSIPYTPILLLTAHDHVSLVEGLDAGADDFIRKPFDIDELRARVRSLLRMKQAMDAKSYMIQQRDDFVARLTHDLRTPLVAANRMLTFCRNEAFGVVADEAKDAIAETISNNQQLLDMVNTLLEVYRHDAGHKALTFTPFNLYDVASTVVNELTPLAKEKQLTLKLVDQDDNPIMDTSDFEMQGDILEIRRVLTNLIGNAIKFTDQGSVEVQLQRTQTRPSQVPQKENTPECTAWLILKVIDTGIGISQEDRAEIFQWFRQGKQRRSGSGLGLHLSCRIAEMHWGHIDATSEVGRGSTFSLFLPVTVATSD
ncbi:hybrid sensor histidine kinase/response regulator [Oscillatoria sp. CS-180]|uniref:ATP-binding response regulator n=1 Tax=Oscillatoria sp. CS-180 TaxID=3021720 RepID=UPI00232B93CD|nr:hybrid sensor histidine kinase/response regulator [Oscillatoria sp. CS-180]MDB9527821.1 hybrid sensor histidine kinase/response regulator [Oscillatoria sp. CS-180]